MSTVATAVADDVLSGRVWLYSNYHCNLTCTYCLTESGPTVPRRELGAERMQRTAEQAAELGFTSLGVTGGEPFLQPEMARTLAALGRVLPTIVLSNGTLFTGARLTAAEVLADSDVAVQVSLDSADPDVNDAARGRDNFAKVVAAIPALVERGIPVRIATTGEGLPTADMERLCELHRRLGVPDADHVVRPIVARGRAVTTGQGISAALEELPVELTISAEGAYASPFGPTVLDGRPDTDLLLTRTTDPLSVPAEVLVRLVEGRPPGSDAALNIR